MSFVLENKTIVVAVGTTSAELVPARTTREHLFLQNNGANNIFIRFGEAVAAITGETSIKLVSGATLLVETPGVSAIQAIAAVATTNLTISETLLKVPLPSGPILFMPLINDLAVITGNGPATFTRSTTGKFDDVQSGLVKTAAIDEPRFEAGGILIEGASTNLLLRSEEFDNASWSKSGTTITPNIAVAPDGNMTADRINNLLGAAGDRVTQIHTDVDIEGQTFDGSIYLKGEDSNIGKTITIGIKRGTGTFIAATQQVTLTDDWQRFSTGNFTGLAGNADVNFNIQNSGDTATSVLAWGAQLEELSFSSSYIPTTTAAVTRTADSLEIPFIGNIPVPTKDYSVTMDFDILGAQGSNPFLYKVEGETIRRTFLQGTAALRFDHSAQANAAIAPNQVFKYAGTKDSSLLRTYLDGVLMGTVAPGVVTGTGTSISIGQDLGDSTRFLNGHIKNFKIFAKALTLSRIKRL